jgi:hypothetical protein
VARLADARGGPSLLGLPDHRTLSRRPPEFRSTADVPSPGGLEETAVAADKDKNPRRNPRTAFRSVADEGCLVVVPTAGTVEVLNPIGGKVYELLDGKHTEDDIVRALVEEFDVSETQARTDLQAFLDELRAKDMLAVAGAEETSDG